MDANATVGGAVSDDVSTVYRLYQRGEELLAAGRSKPAAELLEEAVERAPGNASLYEPLGRALFALSRISDARRAFEQALDVDPTNAFAHFGVGRCCERQGRLTEAAKHFKLATALTGADLYADALRRVTARLEA